MWDRTVRLGLHWLVGTHSRKGEKRAIFTGGFIACVLLSPSPPPPLSLILGLANTQEEKEEKNVTFLHFYAQTKSTMFLVVQLQYSAYNVCTVFQVNCTYCRVCFWVALERP